MHTADDKSKDHTDKDFWGMTETDYIILMHLSQFAGIIIIGLGLVLPIVMWLSNKDKSALIDEHGKIITNWLISAAIYTVISLILVWIVIGIVFLVILTILAIVFPIIGAIKANRGEVFVYPLSIKFF